MSTTTLDSATQTYERLVHMIELRLPVANRRLPSAAALSRQLGVSRPTILEALRRLSDEGRVAVSPGAGGIWALGGQDEGRQQRRRWATDNAEQIAGMTALRRILEPGVARFVAENGLDHGHLMQGRALVAQMRALPLDDRDSLANLDREFHLLVCRATRSPVLQREVEECRAWVAPMFEFVDWPDDRERQSIEEHAQIWAAIEQGDGDAAEKLVIDHVDPSVQLISRTLAEMGSGR